MNSWKYGGSRTLRSSSRLPVRFCSLTRRSHNLHSRHRRHSPRPPRLLLEVQPLGRRADGGVVAAALANAAAQHRAHASPPARARSSLWRRRSPAKAAMCPESSPRLPEVDPFAVAWEARAGSRRRRRRAQPDLPARESATCRGCVRPSAGRDKRGPAAARRLDGGVRRRDSRARALAGLATPSARWTRGVRAPDSGFLLWEDDAPVSLAGWGSPDAHRRYGSAPSTRRPTTARRGYGGAAAAAVSASQLDAGRRFCFLYTDLANLTSNRIYMDIGYEPVCDAVDYAFEHRVDVVTRDRPAARRSGTSTTSTRRSAGSARNSSTRPTGGRGRGTHAARAGAGVAGRLRGRRALSAKAEALGGASASARARSTSSAGDCAAPPEIARRRSRSSSRRSPRRPTRASASSPPTPRTWPRSPPPIGTASSRGRARRRARRGATTRPRTGWGRCSTTSAGSTTRRASTSARSTRSSARSSTRARPGERRADRDRAIRGRQDAARARRPEEAVPLSSRRSRGPRPREARRWFHEELAESTRRSAAAEARDHASRRSLLPAADPWFAEDAERTNDSAARQEGTQARRAQHDPRTDPTSPRAPRDAKRAGIEHVPRRTPTSRRSARGGTAGILRLKRDVPVLALRLRLALRERGLERREETGRVRRGWMTSST